MYKFTWKHVLLELIAACVGFYMVCGGVYFGWYGLDLRNEMMALWGLLVVLPSACAPYFLAAHHRDILFQS
jgi:hypothetical protein